MTVQPVSQKRIVQPVRRAGFGHERVGLASRVEKKPAINIYVPYAKHGIIVNLTQYNRDLSLILL
jgi:hypothetical protein